MNYTIAYRDELYHYGVKGMKWGVRKDYVPKRKQNGHSNESLKKDRGVASVLGPELTTYAIMTASILAVHGAKRLSDLNKQGWFTEKYVASDIKKCSTTKEEDLKLINPIPDVSNSVLYDLGHGKTKADLLPEDLQKVNKAEKDGWFDNCVYCTTAAALRRKGYDVEAKNSPGRGHSIEQTMKQWKGSKIENFLGESTSNPKEAYRFRVDTINKEQYSKRDRASQIAHMESTLSKQGVGAYGDLRLLGLSGGHSVEYSVEKDGVKIYDNQYKQSYSNINEYFNTVGDFDPHMSTYIRLDNCQPDLDRMLKEHTIKPQGR